MLILPLAPAPLAPSEDKFFAHFFHFHFPASNTVLKNLQKYPKNTWIITTEFWRKISNIFENYNLHGLLTFSAKLQTLFKETFELDFSTLCWPFCKFCKDNHKNGQLHFFSYQQKALKYLRISLLLSRERERWKKNRWSNGSLLSFVMSYIITV